MILRGVFIILSIPMRATFKLDKTQNHQPSAPKDVVQTLYTKQPSVSKQEKSRPIAPLRFPVMKIPSSMRTIALIVVVVLGVIFGIRQVVRMRQEDTATSPVPAKLSEKEVRSIVTRVAKHIVLPEEKPQVVVITNVDTLKKQQPFFTTAQNGDQLLVYPSKVILYRPTSDQIVDVAQIRLTPSPSGAPERRISPVE